jgi:hypothetical protein
MAAVCWVWAILAARAFSPITVIVAVGFSTTWLSSIGVMRASKNSEPHVSFDETGTLIQPDPRIGNNSNRLIVSGALSGGLCFFAWVLDVLHIPLFPDDVSHVLPLCSGAASVIFAWIWWRMATGDGLSSLKLTPEGFEFPTVWTVKTGIWRDVEGIADKLPDEERFWNPMVITVQGGRTLMMEAPGIYTRGGTALVEMVRFYWQHPTQRDELTDGRAAARLQRLQESHGPG